MADNFNISRERLATFIKDNDTIRRFEKLFQAVSNSTPENLTIIFSRLDELLIASGSAQGQAISNADALAALVRAIQEAVTRPRFVLPRSFPADYIDFDLTPPYAGQVGRIAWDSNDDTLNIHHSNDVTQQVGLETYARITNNSGATIPNGSAVGFDPATNTFNLFIANGTMNSLNIVGISTESIPNGAQGRITNWGRVRNVNTTGAPFGETWAVGDVLYVSPTVGGRVTKFKPTAPNISLPIAQVRVLNAVTGEIFVRPTIEQQLFYAQIVKTADQVPSAINTAEAITWASISIGNGVSIGAPISRIVVANAGLYKFSTSFQLASTSASVKNVWFWLRKNGVDLTNTALVVSIDTSTAIRSPSRDLLVSLAAGDYVEVMWASDSTAVRLTAIAATAFAPAAPAAILTVNQEQQ